MRSQRYFTLITVTVVILLNSPSLDRAGGEAYDLGQRAASTLPDLSGLAWIDGESFLAVHDAKNPEENQRPRVSIVRLPKSLDGITWEPIEIAWPRPLGLSSDLESAARIPGRGSFLLAESGETHYNGHQFRRIFHVEFRNQQWEVASFTDLPAPVKNIEGTAVTRLGERLVFIFAERADDQPSTNIMWTDLQLQPLKLGALQQARFRPVDFTGPNRRPVSAIEADESGRLYAASTFDPDDDNGPFHSVVWRIGQVKLEGNSRVRVVLDARPQRLATVDGFKVESLAVREQAGGKVELFAGTDDENYGSTLRLIPPKP